MIFVFGSNLAGRHGKGAAKYAALKYGAEYGVGEGRTGGAYALPTKDENLNIRLLSEIQESFQTFSKYAAENHDETFLLTPIGTGLAGYSKREIWSIIASVGITSNVFLASTWTTDGAGTPNRKG